MLSVWQGGTVWIERLLLCGWFYIIMYVVLEERLFLGGLLYFLMEEE